MPGGDDLTEIFLTDGIILTETAFQRAAGEKDGAGAAGPADAGLFPEMKCRSGSFDLVTAATEPLLGMAVYTAGPGTKGAVLVKIRICMVDVDIRVFLWFHGNRIADSGEFCNGKCRGNHNT